MGLIPQDFYLWGLDWLSLQHLWRSRPLLWCVAYLFSPLYFFFGLGNYLLVAEIVQNARAGARWYWFLQILGLLRFWNLGPAGERAVWTRCYRWNLANLDFELVLAWFSLIFGRLVDFFEIIAQIRRIVIMRSHLYLLKLCAFQVGYVLFQTVFMFWAHFKL